MVHDPSLIGQPITLICFAEYSCYVHLDGENHLRIENETEVRTVENTYALFPMVEQGAIKALLGHSITSIARSESHVTCVVEGGVTLSTRRSLGYESVLASISGRTTVLG